MDANKKINLILALEKYLPRDMVREIVKFYNYLQYDPLCKFLTIPALRNVYVNEFYASYPISKYVIEYMNTYDLTCFDRIDGLDMSSRPLYTIPYEIYLLQNLVTLDMSFCKLDEIPCEISLLKKLILLDLNSNELTNLPGELSNMVGLKILQLECNEFQKVPIVLGKMKLSQLYLYGNPLRELPVFLGNELKSQPHGAYWVG